MIRCIILQQQGFSWDGIAYRKKVTITKVGGFVKYQPSAFCHKYFFFLLTKTSDSMKLYSFSRDMLKAQGLSVHKVTVVSQIKPVLAQGHQSASTGWAMGHKVLLGGQRPRGTGENLTTKGSK